MAQPIQPDTNTPNTGGSSTNSNGFDLGPGSSTANPQSIAREALRITRSYFPILLNENGVYPFEGGEIYRTLAFIGSGNTSSFLKFIDTGSQIYSLPSSTLVLVNNVSIPGNLSISGTVSLPSSSNAWLLNGNTLSSSATLGTISNQQIGFVTNNTLRGTINTNGQLSLLTQGTNGGILLGTDALIYRSQADELRTPDSVVVDQRLAIGTSINSTRQVNISTTGAGVVGIRTDAFINGTGTSYGGYFRVNSTAGTGAVSYVAGVGMSVRDDTSSSGTHSEQYGADFDCWFQGTGTRSTVAGARSLLNIASTASGVISFGACYEATIAIPSSALSSSQITGYNFQPINITAGQITALTGLDIRNAGTIASGSSLTNFYGVRVRDLSRATNNYAIFLDGTSGLERQGLWFNGDSVVYRPGANIIGIGANDSLQITDGNIILSTSTGTKIGTSTSQKLAFYNSTPIVKPSVSGSIASGTALTNLLTELANLGLITNSTSA